MKQTVVKTRSFLNPETLLRSVPLEPDMTVVDLGCGNGHYAATAAMLVGKKGQVHAFDILEEALSQTATLARLQGAQNVATRQCDLEKIGSCNLQEQSADVVVVSSILHQLKNKENAIREAYRLLKTGGRLLLVEWKKDSMIGPKVAERIGEKEIREILEHNGFRPARPQRLSASDGGRVSDLPAGSFHYALLYTK
ncbi:MAG: hypothetical protein A3C85_01530 [Candidatus Doudnabacteria bacterium RIFCSPHIGHO2_02_FULL_48_21]|uniref:Methyltransferase domain-containing protein n=1 Tax=Candidatus Doudnabacteria bacterium RIFCSPLOWO2_02_FULL_48_13 TaxID=1817845 RepID=A0A1F5QCM0_9BACT|nr:MAG: hypothetical protein A3K05_00110 [Candidatus Doudnabacteria bacterium RIFCSPHIGHO2_01_48_18]OGE78354.1 MAG: hypothetical protein A2668_04385 [Candidatus Doudnabacteria bacterium RIFCSPHIGHO2_01_FULL_48_180]OGE91725.1 MAG: hypothetical protein A3F44_02565 [Candidatus Doudnabacteria bacterium RIFCSPHIGHO2_12_FULL_47_25]OGE93387.1 MAG: hypothetical protein A3C85_01530 [Candidatus Doudnabacteria bacterium RIFCSPHIGHO2_02_FULL_48_21]OGE97591.1 MAG: hypothetical protein A3A83_00110 [Candidatu